MDSDVKISQARWGDRTFWARFKHFFFLTDPSNCVKSSRQLDEAKDIVQNYKLVFIFYSIFILYTVYNNF